MSRPRLGAEPYEKLTIRVSPATLTTLEQYMRQLRRDLHGLRVDRGSAARRLLLTGLEAAGFPVPQEDLSGHREAPRAEATRAFDADSSGPQAAPTQDHARPSGRTGRKRAKA